MPGRREVLAFPENVVLNLSKKHLHRKTLRLERGVSADGVRPSQALRREVRLARLKASLEGLSAEHRQVILLLGKAYHLDKKTAPAEKVFDEILERYGLKTRNEFRSIESGGEFSHELANVLSVDVRMGVEDRCHVGVVLRAVRTSPRTRLARSQSSSAPSAPEGGARGDASDTEKPPESSCKV